MDFELSASRFQTANTDSAAGFAFRVSVDQVICILDRTVLEARAAWDRANLARAQARGRRTGADLALAETSDLVSLSIIRELGPVLTAMVVAGRVGAAMTAELGTMAVT